MTALTIQPYAVSYQQEVINLILYIQQKEFCVPINIDGQPDIKDISGFYQLNKGNFWVATLNNAVVGTVGLLDIGNDCGVLRKMFVKEAYRGKAYSVGQALLNTTLHYMKKNNFNRLYLGTTEKFIAAQRFYEKNGFTEIEKQALPKAFPLMQVDTKFYKYDV